MISQQISLITNCHLRFLSHVCLLNMLDDNKGKNIHNPKLITFLIITARMLIILHIAYCILEKSDSARLFRVTDKNMEYVVNV